MGWSTRELAALAGTTIRTVRHYHETGLLEEPDRAANGYKSYETGHLVRLLEIRRLTTLGLSLSEVGLFAESGPADLAAVEEDIDARIGLLLRAKADVAALRVAGAVSTDLPPPLSAAASAAGLSEADRSLYAVLSAIAGTDVDAHWEALLRDYTPDAATREFDALPADADEITRQRLATSMAPQVREMFEKHPAPTAVTGRPVHRQQRTLNALVSVVRDLYNPAQLDVMVRVWQEAGVV